MWPFVGPLATLFCICFDSVYLFFFAINFCFNKFVSLSGYSQLAL